MKLNLFNKKVISRGLFLSLICASFTVNAAPKPRQTSHYIYTDSMSEVNAKREKELTFDKDLRTLSKMENRFKERLPRIIPAKKSSKKAVHQKSKIARK